MADNEPAPPASEEDAGRAASGEPAAPKNVAEASRFHPSYVFLAVVTVVNLVADLWSKQWAKSYFESARPGLERRLVIVENYVNFIFAKNRGGAWGLLQNEAEGLRRPFFLVVSVAAIVFIVSLYRKLTPEQRALKWGLPLVLGGALGNLIDRILYGYVIDFIDVYMKVDGRERHWPTFNVADIAICVGVGLMAIDMFSPRKAKAPAAEAVPKDDGGADSTVGDTPATPKEDEERAAARGS